MNISCFLTFRCSQVNVRTSPVSQHASTIHTGTTDGTYSGKMRKIAVIPHPRENASSCSFAMRRYFSIERFSPSSDGFSEIAVRHAAPIEAVAILSVNGNASASVFAQSTRSHGSVRFGKTTVKIVLRFCINWTTTSRGFPLTLRPAADDDRMFGPTAAGEACVRARRRAECAARSSNLLARASHCPRHELGIEPLACSMYPRRHVSIADSKPATRGDVPWEVGATISGAFDRGIIFRRLLAG